MIRDEVIENLPEEIKNMAELYCENDLPGLTDLWLLCKVT